MLKVEKVNWMKFKMTTIMTKVRKMTMLLMKMRSLKTLRGNLDWCSVKLTSRIFHCFILTIDCQKKGRYRTKNRNLFLHKIQIKMEITVTCVSLLKQLSDMLQPWNLSNWNFSLNSYFPLHVSVSSTPTIMWNRLFFSLFISIKYNYWCLGLRYVVLFPKRYMYLYLVSFYVWFQFNFTEIVVWSVFCFS